jgi:hypothetical protein
MANPEEGKSLISHLLLIESSPHRRQGIQLMVACFLCRSVDLLFFAYLEFQAVSLLYLLIRTLVPPLSGATDPFYEPDSYPLLNDLSPS